MEKSIKELREWAMKADNNKFFQRAASMQIRLNKLERIDKPRERQSMRLNVKEAERSGNITIKAVAFSKSFENKLLFKNANLLVSYGERVGLIGPNGCGKTTFIRLLLGEEQADSGIVELGANVRLAYLPQKLTFTNDEQTVLESFREDLFIPEGKAREYLAKFMFYGSNVFKKIKHLSGGERVRLKLAIMLYQDVNLLILDEPTNHLDTESIETIEAALENFKGTIFNISHDRYFLNKMADRIIAIENHIMKSYAGNYDYYKESKEKESNKELTKQEELKDKRDKPVNSGVKNKNLGYKATFQKSREKDYAMKSGENNEYKKALEREGRKENSQGYSQGTDKDMNKGRGSKTNNRKEAFVVHKIEELEEQLKEIEALMEEATTNHEVLQKLYLQREKLNKELEKLLEQWLCISQ